MDHIFYKQEIERLKNQWPNSYSEERMIIFFNAFRNAHQMDFHDAVSYCLANCRSAPLLPELTEAIIKMQTHRKAQERYDQSNRQRDDLFSAIKGAALENKTSDPAFVLKCLRIKSDFENKKIDRKQLDKLCDELDKEAEILTKKKGTYENPENWKELVEEATRIVEDQKKNNASKDPFFTFK